MEIYLNPSFGIMEMFDNQFPLIIILLHFFVGNDFLKI